MKLAESQLMPPGIGWNQNSCLTCKVNKTKHFYPASRQIRVYFSSFFYSLIILSYFILFILWMPFALMLDDTWCDMFAFICSVLVLCQTFYAWAVVKDIISNWNVLLFWEQLTVLCNGVSDDHSVVWPRQRQSLSEMDKDQSCIGSADNNNLRTKLCVSRHNGILPITENIITACLSETQRTHKKK